MSSDGVADVVPGRSAGLKADEDPEVPVVVALGDKSQQVDFVWSMGCGRCLWWQIKSERQWHWRQCCYRLVQIRTRCAIGVGQNLFPLFEEATGEVLGEVAFWPSSKFLGGLVVGGDLLVDELLSRICDGCSCEAS